MNLSQQAPDFWSWRNGVFRFEGERNLGNAYDSLGEYQLAIDYLQQSLSIKR